jgi:hypothetical protein
VDGVSASGIQGVFRFWFLAFLGKAASAKRSTKTPQKALSQEVHAIGIANIQYHIHICYTNAAGCLALGLLLPLETGRRKYP